MPNRREFLSSAFRVGVGSAILARAGTSISRAETASSRAAAGMDSPLKPLRILVLGDGSFIGQHHVRAALNRGHKVTVFSRAPTLLPSVVEQLSGDREGDLGSAQDRDWDAVIDTTTSVPLRVRTLGQALTDRVRHYTFISSVDVYDRADAVNHAIAESSGLVEYQSATDPYTVAQAEGTEYGPLRVLCEREAEARFPGKTLIVRPGLMVGPGDPAGAFTYWPVRMEQGGEILAAGDPMTRVQMIDVRDVADWVIRMAEKGETGTFNAVGPAQPLTWGDMLAAIQGRRAEPVKLTWAPETWLAEQGVPPLSNLRFWPSEAGIPGSMHVSNDKARDRGLAFRPLPATAADTLAWYWGQPKHRQTQLLLGLTGMFSMEDSMEHERELLGAWHSYQMRQSR
jgi:2'-hydroxyisoflavone reductase